MTDEHLMIQVRDGSQEAFEMLFERHQDAVWRFFRRRLAHPARAEELVQDVFVAVLQNASRYEPRSAFRSYLFGIAYNVLKTERRLTEVLKNRTGKVSDVLEVEREIARVREEIERLDAQRVNLERRVTYATITLQVTEQRQATLDMGPLPVRVQLRNALVDGLRQAYESGIDVVLWVLQVAPVLLLWTALLWWPARILLRAIRARATASG
jgi:RNA polymerase sigma factor (sigma-70 family)